MKQRFPHGFLLLSVLLTACGQEGVPKDALLTLIPGLNAVQVKESGPETVKLPQAAWKVEGAPEWLTVSQTQRSGESLITFRAAPLGAAVQPDAQASALSALVTLRSVRGLYTVRVTSPLTLLSGTVPSVPRPLAPQAREPLPEGAGRVVVQWFTASGAVTAQAQPGLPLREQRFSDGSVTQVLDVPNVAAAVSAFQADSRVKRAFPESRMRAAQAAQGDPLAPYQWHLSRLGYSAVQADQPGNYPNAVTVAVLDTGVRADHPDLAGRLRSEGAVDLISDPLNGDGDGVDLDPTDPGVPGGGSHGTAVTGVIVAAHNTTGIVGAALDAPVTVQAIRVLGSSNDGDTAEIMLGVRYAAGETVTVGGQTLTNPRPANIINLSLGESGRSFTDDQKAFICEAVSAATRRGALVVAAAGNSGAADAQYPAACPDALAVGAVTLNSAGQWERAPYSAYGPHVRISAPGGNLETNYAGLKLDGRAVPDGILTTNWPTGAVQGDYLMEQGTSFATPQVSALAALMLSKGVTTTAAQTVSRLISSAADVGAPGRDEQTGAGVIQAAVALGLAAPSTPSAPAYFVRISDVTNGKTFSPPVDASGAWKAYLGAGTYDVVQGVDADLSSTLEDSELRSLRRVTLRADEPQTVP